MNTKGKNDAEVPPELVRFLKFVTAGLEESERDFQDELVRRFQKTIREIKTDREMGERYMIFEEMLREEKQEGRRDVWKRQGKIFWNFWKTWGRFRKTCRQSLRILKI